MSRSRFAAAALVAGLVTFAGGRLLRADGPAPASDSDAARIKQLVENLGSDDFRVREAATKALIGMGEKARAALTEAAKSEMPEVRFRADQILRRLDGANRPRGLEGGEPGQPGQPGQPGHPGQSGAGGTRGRFFGNDDWERWQKEIERQTEEMRKRLESGWGVDPGQPGLLLPQLFSSLGRRSAPRRFTAEGAELQVSRGNARLTFTDRGTPGLTVTTTYEGMTLDAILAAKPELKDRPGVASLVEQAAKADADEKARVEKLREGLLTMPGGRGTTSFQMNGVTVESTPGHVKVTVTEPGDDGKPVTKTYEGTDLEALKAEHPELKDRLGGVMIWSDSGPGGPVPMPGSRVEKDEDGESDEADETLPTGPFGLALSPVDAAARARLGLAEGEGMVVRAVRPDSGASSQGLLKGDVILKVNGVKVDAKVGIADLIHRSVGGSRTFEIVRNGKPKTLTIGMK